ncbi:unnamed protein product [Cuscuta campestris]|uniref:Uncharacterized protein n=1 Tax=Cuscuta campestris TaxID=132261 RepID=A0A484MI15_9ASTE|nr:unnamed protein product [Cuscuta campestris]
MEDALGFTKFCTGPRGEDEVSSVFEAMNEDNGKSNAVKVIDDDPAEEFPKVENSMSLDTLKLFDLDDIEKFEYLAPLRVVRHIFGFASTILCYASVIEICNDGSPGGDLLWFNPSPFIQKHEWEPPP